MKNDKRFFGFFLDSFWILFRCRRRGKVRRGEVSEKAAEVAAVAEGETASKPNEFQSPKRRRIFLPI